MIYSIHNKELTASISDLGAELVSVAFRGSERLWQNENGAWSGHAPILFPFCGRCRMVLGGEDYGSGFHGFASKEAFACVRKDETSACFLLTDNEQTKKQYPFAFAFFVEYAVCGSQLSITYRVENRSQSTMYFACGAHDSFALASEVTDYALEFPKSERFLYQLHDDSGRLTGRTEDHGSGTLLPLENRDPSVGDTVILKDIQSDSVFLTERKSEKRLASIEFPGFSNLLLWHPKGSRMICIEPWQNLPDDADKSPEFTAKPGIQKLQPSAQTSYTRTIRYY